MSTNNGYYKQSTYNNCYPNNLYLQPVEYNMVGMFVAF